MSGTRFPRVSVVLATRNEEAFIENALTSVLANGLAPGELEIIVADGMSTDGTRRILARMAAEHPCIRMVENPRRIAPSAFNLAIRESQGDTILLLSAHSTIDSNYIEVCLRKMEESGADVVGGCETAVAANDTLQAQLVAGILGLRFGVGASFRTAGQEGFVDTVSPALYHRRVFERVGLFDERLVRNQDNELNARLRGAGGRILMTRETNAYYIGRATVKALLVQNYRNGLYGALNWRITPGSFRPRHMVPSLFVLGLVVGGILLILGKEVERLHYLADDVAEALYFAALGLYIVLGAGSAIGLAWRTRKPSMLIATVLFLPLHVVYGFGTLSGIFRFLFAPLAPGNRVMLPPREGP